MHAEEKAKQRSHCEYVSAKRSSKNQIIQERKIELFQRWEHCTVEGMGSVWHMSTASNFYTSTHRAPSVTFDSFQNVEQPLVSVAL